MVFQYGRTHTRSLLIYTVTLLLEPSLLFLPQVCKFD